MRLTDTERVVINWCRAEGDGGVCADQFSAEEQAAATRLARRGVLVSSREPGCKRRHYRIPFLMDLR